jgi:GeoRSP system SPASM domain protein
MFNNLINPFIIYWDVNPDTFDDDIALRICDELVETKIFVLNVRDLSVPLNDGTINILKRLSSKQIRINLTAKSEALEQLHIQEMKKIELAKLYVEFDLFEDLQSSVTRISDWINHGFPVGVSFYLHGKNFKEIPSVLSLCIENNIKDVKFPIQRAGAEKIVYPDSETARWLSEELKRLPLENLRLTIHDPFLWKLIYEKDNPNEEGCNGAKTMMYIDGNYDVTPCPILPVSMGNFRRLSLKEICSSEKRRELRKDLSTPPEECNSCSIVNKCNGGCRGRAYMVFRSFDKLDPACQHDFRLRSIKHKVDF